MELHVTTWNLLHRVHAANWSEGPTEELPDERSRIARISAVVARWLEREDAVVCLQEVSGDQLASLRSVVSGKTIYVHQYPRVPRLRRGGPSELEDATEHLVTITGVPSKRWREATFETDPGKGLLAIVLGDGTAVINTHVSARERGEGQLRLLGATARDARAGAVVVGDFNAPASVVRAGLGESFELSKPAEARPTRVATASHPAKTIDHVAVIGGSIVSTDVLEGAGLSDHNPVAAKVLFAEHG